MACYNLAMPRNQFVVPQFLDVEAKIIGPITARQFLIMLATILMGFIVYRIFLSLFVVILIDVPLLGTGLAFAFAKVNGQPFHFLVVSLIQTLRRPNRRVWDKSLSDADLRVYLKKEDIAVPVERVQKKPLERSRLSELTLVVNTGGVYEGDDSLS
jgi:hypothetical protein